MRIAQVTLTSTATPLIPAGTPNIYASALSIQNNSTHLIHIGDNTVSATRGQSANIGGGFYTAVCPPKGTLLNQWFIFGTSGDVIDFLYEQN